MMHTHVSFDRQIISPEEAFLPTISAAAFYGRGVFSTVAVYREKLFLWEKHWRRLNDNAHRIGIDLSDFSEESVKNSLLEIVKKNGFQNGRARITFFDQALSGVWSFKSDAKTSCLIVTADRRQVKKNFSMTVSPFRINSHGPLAGVKSCNYLEKIMALEDAKKKGFDEALCLNELGEIVSASTANIFWVKNGRLFTASRSAGCLPGTTREFIMENFPVQEKRAVIDELIRAEEIFLTSAGVGVVRVKSLENNCYLSFKAAEKLQKFLKNCVKK